MESADPGTQVMVGVFPGAAGTHEEPMPLLHQDCQGLRSHAFCPYVYP
jgi:hypothetical protein